MRIQRLLDELLPQGHIALPPLAATADDDDSQFTTPIRVPSDVVVRLLRSLDPPISSDAVLAFVEPHVLASQVAVVLLAKDERVTPSLPQGTSTSALINSLLDLRNVSQQILAPEPISARQSLALQQAAVCRIGSSSNVAGAGLSGLPPLPQSILRICANKSAASQDLCDAGELVQLAGPRHSGKRTLLLHSLIRSLVQSPHARALWIITKPTSDVASTDQQRRIALRAVQVIRAISARATDEAGGELALSALDRLEFSEADSPEKVLDAIDKGQASLPSEGPLKVVVLDSMATLFATLMPGAKDGGGQQHVGQAALVEMLQGMTTRARREGLRIYLHNASLSSKPRNPLSSFAAVEQRAALEPQLPHLVDATLWLDHGSHIFEQDDDVDGDEMRTTDRSSPGDTRGTATTTMLFEAHKSGKGEPGGWATFETDVVDLLDVTSIAMV